MVLYFIQSGKSATNDLGNAYNVSGITIGKAEKIAYRNLTYYLSPYSEFTDARTYSIQAASDLFGSCSNEVLQTTNAWYAVGVGNAYSTTLKAKFSTIDSNICSTSDTIYFLNLSTGASTYLWDFGDGNTSTNANPSHKYSNYGNYNVKLKVTNWCGNFYRFVD